MKFSFRQQNLRKQFWSQWYQVQSFLHSTLTLQWGDRGSTMVKVLCYKSEGRWFEKKKIPAGVSGFFIDIKSFRSHYGPGVDSASNRNEYQEYFLGVKAAGA